MDDPKVTIGGREFVVPEFSIRSQRKVSPALMKVAQSADNIENEESFGRLIDTIYLCLTIEGANKITKDEFEALKMKALPLATEVIPVLLRQAGLSKAQEPTNGKGGAAAGPDTPLPGENISTTLSQTSSSPPAANGTQQSGSPPAE